MILIDSSVWIYYYRPKVATELKERVKEAIRRDLAALNGLIYVEVLSGISRQEDFDQVDSDFKGFHLLQMNENVFRDASALGSSLRRKGITIPSTDLIIAATALNAKTEIYHIDAHFDLITSQTKLKAENFKAYI